MTTQEKYERYIMSKTHDYTQSLTFPYEFNIYLPNWVKRWGVWHRNKNIDIPKKLDMKPIEVKGKGLLGPNGNIYTLYILGYIPLSLHNLRTRDEDLASGWTRWWCRLDVSGRA